MNIKALKKFRKRYAYYFTKRKYNGKKYIGAIIVDKKTKEVHIFDIDARNSNGLKKSMYQKFINRDINKFIYEFFNRQPIGMFRETMKYWLHK